MTSLTEKSKTIGSNNSNKSSMRRLNQLVNSEQQRRLAPVFENTGPYNVNVHKLRSQFSVNPRPPVVADTGASLNQQLFFLRKSLNKTYDTAAESCKDPTNQSSSGKSTESIYKTKGSLITGNYSSIGELEKRASSILMNKNCSPKGELSYKMTKPSDLLCY